MSEMHRDFKGIWIPREIWLHKELKVMEKMLWAEIHSLYSREMGGCYASNEYFVKMFGVSERYIREMISNLKRYGVVQEVSFNGRTRIIRATIPPEDFGQASSGLPGTTVPGREEPQFRSTRNHSSGLSYIERKEERKEEIYNPLPPNTGVSKTAIGGGGLVKKDSSFRSYGEHVKLTDDQYQKLEKKFTKPVLEELIEAVNDYVAGGRGKPYDDWAAGIRTFGRNRAERTKKTPSGGYAPYDAVARHRGFQKDTTPSGNSLDLRNEVDE